MPQMKLASAAVAAAASEAAPRVDLFALQRALVFTKETYRTLRERVTPQRRPALDLDAARADALASLPLPVPPKPLTPWDLMDDDDTELGVTFTTFQRAALAARTAPFAAAA